MRGIIVYYSATGNNKKIASAIQRGMRQVIEADAAGVKEVSPKDMGQYDLIGFGSPIWFQRETANLRQFVYDMPDLTGKLGFVYSVHGVTSGYIFHSMIPPIQRKGLTIIGWNDWYGTYFSSMHRIKPAPCDGHPDAVDLKEAEEWGRELAERAQRIYAGEKGLIPEIPRGPDADLLFHPYGVMRMFAGLEKPNRTVNMELCKYPECMQCIDNCEANALDFSVDPPAYNIKTCVNCCLCDRMCPEGAIEISDEEMRLLRTMREIDMEKCKYPECTICLDNCPMNAIDFSVTPPVFKRSCEGDDLCWTICPEGAIEVTNLDVTHRYFSMGRQPPATSRPRRNIVDEREAQGRFRRLVPKDAVGTDGYIMDIERTPRFDINELMGDEPLSTYHGMPDHGSPDQSGQA